MWKRAGEIKPPNTEPVLSFSSDGIRISRYDDDTVTQFSTGWSNAAMDSCGCCGSYEQRITHWTELPTPP